MKSQIKNIHSDAITIFVKKDGVEQQIEIPKGHSIIVDNYETRTIKLFAKRGFITIESTRELLENKNCNILKDRTEDELQKEEENAILDATNRMKTEMAQNTNNSTRLEVVESEVEQYIEGGYIKGEWTEEDIEFLKKNYPIKGRKYCATQLNRKETSIQKKITNLNIKKKNRKINKKKKK